MSEEENHILPHRRRSDLPSLAAREQESPVEDSPPATSPTAQEAPTTVRRARLSHRSRAGCWTCRGRKVKCDEQRPRCGQCLRLNRECDWEHRWNFNHATSTTQSRHANVLTAGSVVWDQRARSNASSLSRSTSNDNLPAFATLTNDDDRERKARLARPGTYSIVVTPESFVNLPEYASSGSSSPTPRLVTEQRRLSVRSSSLVPGSSGVDNNTVVLNQFEDVSPSVQIAAASRQSISSRSSSLPGGTLLPHLSMFSNACPPAPPTMNPTLGDDEKYTLCFNEYIVYRLIQWVNDTGIVGLPNLTTTRDFIQLEAGRYPPLSSAMNALSALHLHYTGQEQLAQAVNFYDQALDAHTPLDQDDHLSDGVFLRHFLLYVYDISMTALINQPYETTMSATNLSALQRIAVQRYEKNHGEKFAHVVWILCLFDLEACFLGSGDCEYIRALLQRSVMPALSRRLLQGESDKPLPLTRETALLVNLLDFKQGIVVQLAKLASLAKSLRQIVLSADSSLQETFNHCRQAAYQAQTDLRACWTRSYPDDLDESPSVATTSLGLRTRLLFEHTVALYGAGLIYSHASMFPGQRSLPRSDQASVDAEIEACTDNILGIASNMLAAQQLDQRWIIFPVFMAGIASKQSDEMVRALEIIKGFEGSGIGQNTMQVRQLLSAVNEEQSQRITLGRPMEDVDWQSVAAERGFRMSNCGL